MSEHIDVVKRAIEFKKPKYLPMEIVNVPGIYNAYWTIDPEDVLLVPGTENFDSIWVLGFWFPKEIGSNENGEIIREDEFGIISKIPLEESSAYSILKEPLRGKESLEGYNFPDISKTDEYFEKLKSIIDERYRDRFICGYIDPGAFLVASLLMGTDELYIKLATDLDFVIEVIEGIFEYQYKAIQKFEEAGVHMLVYLDEFAGSSGMMFDPVLYKKYFMKYYKKFFKLVHESGMYTGIALDGNFSAILDDIINMGVDVLHCPETRAIGLDVLEDRVKGKICIKCGIDMMHTLAIGTPEQVRKEANDVVNMLNSKDGGLICEVLRWYRPAYPENNVQASVKAFNEYRKNAPGY